MLKLLQHETTQVKFLIGFGLSGFMIGIALCAYTFYLRSHHQIGNMALFLLLCPPSIGAIALDNAGVLGSVIGWLFISLGNAGLYAGIGLALGAATQKSK
jgi:hypothetical protein